VCGFRLYVKRDNAPAQAAYRRLGMAETQYVMYEQMAELKAP
jgi:ribosomal protein S18 acetylase RimI-like enzyme